MAKEALLFSGQGLSPGDMTGFYRDLKTCNPGVTERWRYLVQDSLDKVHGKGRYDVKGILEDGGAPEVFDQTAFVQPVVFGLSVAALESANDLLNPKFVAGHSLGEYAALVAAGVLEPEMAKEIVVCRGQLMQEAGEKNPGKLISLVGADLEVTQNLCNNRRNGSEVAEIALVNAPNLIVVGCAKGLVEEVEALAGSLRIRKTVILKTGGAYHTSGMRDAATDLKTILLQRAEYFRNTEISIVPNLTGEAVSPGKPYPLDYLVYSMTRPVQWARSMQTLCNLGVDTFIEVGPGNSLRTLGKLNGIPEASFRNILDVISKAPVWI